MISLNEILQYKNDYLIQRYQRDYPNNQISADEALQELLRYFWIAHQHQIEKNENPSNEDLHFICGIYPEMAEVDDMWHTFLLFTEDYTHFCEKYFGKFIHHVPEEKESEQDSENFEIELTRYLSYVYDHLGPETLKNWFKEYD